MNTILRNFLSILRRFRMAAFLNIAGLAVAFAAFIVILIQINYERNFDRFHPTSKQIFRINLNETGIFSALLPRGLIDDVINSSPHIKAGTLLTTILPPLYFSITENGEKRGFREEVQTCYPSFIQIFGFTLLEGNPDCLSDPEKILIPESLSHKLFGEQSAIGKSIHAEESVWTKDRKDFTVGGVYHDFPTNTQLNNVIYMAIDGYAKGNYRSSSYIGYLLLDDATSAQDVATNFNAHFDFSKLGRNNEKGITLVPLTDIYYRDTDMDQYIIRSGNKEITLLLFGIALLILTVAVINFTNFSTALTPMRIKSINIQKVLGSSDAMLRSALLAEAVCISMIAWLGSLSLVWFLSETASLPFVEANLSLLQNWQVTVLSAGVATVTGIVAGLYPSWYVTSFPPALVLKGNFGLSSTGRKLRTILIGIQFIVSIVLIVAAGFVRIQNHYMQNYSLGFDKSQIAIVNLSGDIYNKYRDTYTNRLKEFTGINDVAFSFEKVGSLDMYNTNTVTYKGKADSYFMILVSSNFLNVMGIPVEEGRNFTPADEQTENAAMIFNRTAHINNQMAEGDEFGSWITGRIIGFTGDVKLTSLRQGENNIAFVVGKTDIPLTVSYIRLNQGTDTHAAVEHIRETLAGIDPSYPFDVEFYDTIFNQLYHKEENLRSLITLFSLLAITLSLVGVFGLVVFDTQYRRKEIGIRKVHGATLKEILGMLNKQYIYIVLTCFVIAVPLSWFGVKKWLESFAYKTPIYWWVFLIALIIVLAITIATVTFQSWRTANTNPVELTCDN